VVLLEEGSEVLEYRRGDILQAEAEAIVNTVNCVGIMGRGIALQFQKAFPDNYKAYKEACSRKEVVPGSMFIFDTGQMVNPRYIVNFPTKRHWKSQSRLDDIKTGLAALARELKERGIHSVAIPPLGCGLGGLSWNEVRPLIEKTFEDNPGVGVLVYEPIGAPKPECMAEALTIPEMTLGKATLLSLMRRYLSAVMDPSISLLEIHKLMYFMQEAGEPLRLRYVKALYGPYAENLRHPLSRMEGHFISGYGDAEDDPERQIELLPEASEKAEESLKSHPKTLERFKKVCELIEGFETPFGMELLATVHWVATREEASSADSAIEKVYEWNSRKRRFEPKHIRIAWDVLSSKGWIDLRQPSK
jgi:O-acetyl-ADP-ribose deacetylase (regulator of RNase III)